MTQQRKYKIIISGGGTGGHIFPAIAIADALSKSGLVSEILFVGAIGRMEMEKVPAAGYSIEGLDIVGIQRSLTLKNLKVPVKIIKSLIHARRIVKNFQPDIAIGVGGYASGPVLFAASSKGIPTIIQEQNSYPGITNKILCKKADKIFVAYPNMEQFFPSNKIIYSGNPVRDSIVNSLPSKEESCQFFGLDPQKPVVLSFGGSLGALTLNDSIEKALPQFEENDTQLIWQTGSYYYNKIINNWKDGTPKGVQIHQFIKEMHYAYGAADLIISRAGALSISELCIVGKPTILVPSPNVSEDHQTKNAMALVDAEAAILVKDNESRATLSQVIFDTLKNQKSLQNLAINIKSLAKPEATNTIVQSIEKLLQQS